MGDAHDTFNPAEITQAQSESDPIRERAERLKELVCAHAKAVLACSDAEPSLSVMERAKDELDEFINDNAKLIYDDLLAHANALDKVERLEAENVKLRADKDASVWAEIRAHDLRAVAEAERDTLRTHADELASAVDGWGDIHEREFKIAAAKYWCAFPNPATQTEGE